MLIYDNIETHGTMKYFKLTFHLISQRNFLLSDCASEVLALADCASEVHALSDYASEVHALSDHASEVAG